jgi:flagellar basal-body rod protein FlgF
MAASGASSQMTALDATANNLANATTVGYKAEQAVFQEHLIAAVYSGKAQKEMRYNGVAEISSDMRGGPLQVTNRSLDAAIEGDGFFAIRTPRGERYTRAGNFQLGPSGALVTSQGYPVLDTSGNPMQVSLESRQVDIGQDGTLRVDGEAQEQFRVVTFGNLRALEKEGEQLFRPKRQKKRK